MDKKIVHYRDTKIEIDIEVSKEYIKLVNEIDRLKKQLAPIEGQLKEELRETMRKLDVKDFTSNGIQVKLSKDSVRNSFDTNKFKVERPKLYKEYLTTTNVKGSLSIDIEGV